MASEASCAGTWRTYKRVVEYFWLLSLRTEQNWQQTCRWSQWLQIGVRCPSGHVSLGSPSRAGHGPPLRPNSSLLQRRPRTRTQSVQGPHLTLIPPCPHKNSDQIRNLGVLKVAHGDSWVCQELVASTSCGTCIEKPSSVKPRFAAISQVRIRHTHSHHPPSKADWQETSSTPIGNN